MKIKIRWNRVETVTHEYEFDLCAKHQEMVIEAGHVPKDVVDSLIYLADKDLIYLANKEKYLKSVNSRTDVQQVNIFDKS